MHGPPGLPDSSSVTGRRDRTLVFLHIGRTAGTTLSRILWRQYPRSAVHKLDKTGLDRAVAVLAGLPEDEKRGIELITGHGCFGLHRLLPQPVTYLTVLRDPIQRAVSHYHYVRKWPMHPLHERVNMERVGLLEYVSSGMATDLNNFQTRVISGYPPSSHSELPNGILEEAKRNVERHFSVVGLSERFDETLLLLGRTMGLRRLWYEPLNVGEHGPALAAVDDEVTECIVSHNQLDIELYEHARSRFDDEVASIAERDGALRRLQRRNRLYAPWTITYRRAREAKLHFESRMRRSGAAAG